MTSSGLFIVFEGGEGAARHAAVDQGRGAAGGRDIAAMTGAILAARAQGAWPDRSVRWVVGYPPGGATDIIARLIGQRLSEKLGQPVVIENKPGANGIIGTEQVKNAPADGYTLLLATNTGQAVAPHRHSKPYSGRFSLVA